MGFVYEFVVEYVDFDCWYVFFVGGVCYCDEVDFVYEVFWVNVVLKVTLEGEKSVWCTNVSVFGVF